MQPLERLAIQLETTSVEQFASPRWIGNHAVIVRFSLLAAMETAQLEEETVHRTLLSTGKLNVLVHQVIASELWRRRIWPKLDLGSSNSTLVYSVFYNEACILSLLESVLYHGSACEALDDHIVDLIDYCYRQLVALTAEEQPQSGSSSQDQRILHILWTIPLRCMAILRFIAGHCEHLSPSVTRRMLNTLDVPLLAGRLIDIQPWIRQSGQQLMIYRSNQWIHCSTERRQHVETSQVHPCAAQVWLLLLQLLLGPDAVTKYQITDYRREQLLKLRKYLDDNLLDQLPALTQLRNWLTQLSLGVHQPAGNSKALILELVAELHDTMAESVSRDEQQIVTTQQRLLNPTREELAERVQLLSAAYDLDLLEAAVQSCDAFAPEQQDIQPPPGQDCVKADPLCEGCGKTAKNRCSRCRRSFYCGRECQGKHWPIHKTTCAS